MVKIDDSELGRMALSTVCVMCKHFIKGYSCSAFESIPLEIWNGTNDHTRPYSGDNGIQFEPITEGDTDASINRNQRR